MGSLRSLQGKKCSKTMFFRIFYIEKGKAQQTPIKSYIFHKTPNMVKFDFLESINRFYIIEYILCQEGRQNDKFTGNISKQSEKKSP